jgi:MarR family transcriptional regulator, organic hydroperoxide resistance regulator
MRAPSKTRVRPQRAAKTATRGRHVAQPFSLGDTERMLQHWRDAVPNDRMAHLIKDATRALVRSLHTRLAAHGVSFGHWTFLRILWESDGLTQRELSREAGVMEPTTFTALKAMERSGYIVRRQMGGNRRKVHIFLTASGRALKRSLVPLAETVNRIALRGVALPDIAATRRTLMAMLVNLARDELTSVQRAAGPGNGALRRPMVPAPPRPSAARRQPRR